MVPAVGLGAGHFVMPKRQVLQRATKHERKKERAALGRLRAQVVSQKTEHRYLGCVSRFLTFLKSSKKPYPSSFLLLDRYLCEFIEELWHDGEPKGYASDALSGIGHFIPSAKPHMIAAWRLHAPCRAPPFTAVILYGLSQAAYNKGWDDTAVLLILGFHTFGRSGELFNAQCKDFVLSGTAGTWTLPHSKSGQRTGMTESILLDDPFVCKLLQNYLRRKAPGDLLTKVSPQVQRKRLYDLIEALHLRAPYRWYSVRRGGATHFFRQAGNLGQICLKGRWNSQKTAKIYITEGVAQLTELQLPPAQLRVIKALAMRARPSWQQYF